MLKLKNLFKNMMVIAEMCIGLDAVRITENRSSSYGIF